MKTLVVHFQIWRKKVDRFWWEHKGKTHRSGRLSEARAFAKANGYSNVLRIKTVA